MRYAMYMATEFMYQQLHGNNAAAIDDPNTGLRFMNDLATYEIFWHFLYLTVFHGAELTADGKYSKKGERVTPELFVKLLDERRETVKELFKKLGTKYEDTDAELVLQILKRQVVDDTGGTLVPQQRWIKYGSRVLLSLDRAERRRSRGDPRRDLQPSRASELLSRVRAGRGRRRAAIARGARSARTTTSTTSSNRSKASLREHDRRRGVRTRVETAFIAELRRVCGERCSPSRSSC